MIGYIFCYSLLGLLSSVFANTGVFHEQYNRVYASGSFNELPPQLNTSRDLNNVSINSMFYNGDNSNFIIDSFNTELGYDLDVCRQFCSINPDCAGIFIKELESLNLSSSSSVLPSTFSTTTITTSLEREEHNVCNILSNLGGEMLMPSNYTSESYKKTISYSNSSTTDIEIILLNMYSSSSSEQFFPYNTTVYFDLNNNNMLDEGEPNKTVELYDYEFVNFEGLEPLTYHIRQIIHNDTCKQVYPGIEGSFFFIINEAQNHYADRVVSWQSSINGHHNLRGGAINNTYVNYSEPSLEYILGNSSNTFLSFCPSESITLAFVDDVIINREGDDLFFNLVNLVNSSDDLSTYANVYISYDNQSWTPIGNLSYDSSSIDLTVFNYQSHANYLRLDFEGENHNSFLNISSIKLGSYKRYYQPFTATIDTSVNNYGVFLNDCFESRYCGDYCNLNFYENADYYSCLAGCYSFTDNYFCDCDLDNTTLLDMGFNLERYTYNPAMCFNGCAYSIDTYLNTNLYAFPAHQGNSRYEIDPDSLNSTIINNLQNNSISGEYLLEVFNICNSEDTCRGFSINENGANFYSKLYERVQNPDSIFLVKLGDYTSPTTTATSSQTTTATSSQTTTATSSQTTTATSSQTTTATSSQTTTATSSQTTTATSSQTTTATSSQTTTATSSQTTTATSSQTTTATSSQTTTATSSPTTTNTLSNNAAMNSMASGEIIGISIMIILIVIGLAMAIFVFYKRNRQTGQIHNINAYDNPVYDAEPDMENPPLAESLYSDVPVDNNVYNEDGYMDVSPPSPSVSTFYNTEMESPEIVDPNTETNL